ncbi:MAG: cation:proton antiporter [Chloroflexota bacterium]|nr:cation:proton antiporter [Chloroflexota bacterium]
MELHEALFAVGALIVMAKLLEGIFKRIGLNAIFAYPVAGVILGPATGLVHTGPSIDLVLSIGIFMFFFLIGLEELDIAGFVAAIRGRIFFTAVLAVTLSMLASLAVTTDIFIDLGLDLSLTQALGLAGVLSLSSLGVVAKALVDEGRLREPVGVQIFTAVIIVELIALFVVGFAISEHFTSKTGGIDAMSVLLIIGEIIAFAVVTWFVASKIVPRALGFLQRLLRVPQFAFGTLVGGLFLVVVIAEQVGLHGSLGALLFGAALSFLPYQMRRDIMPGMRGTAEGFFVPLFFASAGLYFSLDFIKLPVETILALAFLPLLGKVGASFLSAYVTRIRAPFATAVGLTAKGVAEIALLLVMLHSEAIGKDIFSLLVVVMLAYIMLTPLGIGFALRRVARWTDAESPEHLPPSFERFVLDEVRVSDLLDPYRVHPEASQTVKDFAEDWLLQDQHDYVVEDHGKLAGIVSVSMLRYLPRVEWDTTPLSQMLRHETPKALSNDYLEDALQRMTENSLSVLPVVDAGTGAFMGSISSHEILEMLLLSARGE